MTDDFDGAEIIDNAGDKIGAVERTYVDDSGAAHFLAVKIGLLMVKHRLVPAVDLVEVDGGIQIAYSKQVVEDSPDVESDDTLEGSALDAARAYYLRIRAEQNGYTGSGSADGVSDHDLDPAVVSAIGETDQRNRPADDFPASGELDQSLSESRTDPSL